MQKILVVFYSRTGNTAKVAKDLAFAFDADIEEIIDKKNRKGFLGFLLAGLDAHGQKKTEIAPATKDPAGYDLIIIGGPIWASAITPAIRTYLDANKEKIAKYAFFITSSNTDSASIAETIKAISGKDPITHVSLNKIDLVDKNAYDQKLGTFIANLKSLLQM